MIKLPPNSQWRQSNYSDILGSIYASFGLDLTSNKGKLRLGKRLLLNAATADTAELTSYAVGFRYFNANYWTVAGLSGTGYPFNCATIQGTTPFAKVVNGGGITGLVTTFDSLYSDIEIAFDKLHISNASDGKVYYSADGITWSTLTAGAAGDPVMMTFYGGRMYCTKGKNLIQSWESTPTVVSPSAYPNTTSNTLRLSAADSGTQAVIITFLRSTSSRIWIGTVSKTGGKGYMYAWDGAQASVNESYRLDSAGALACVIKDDIPYILDADGKLLAFNGGTFQEVDRLNRVNGKILFNPFDNDNSRFIHPNGMSLINGKINMLIDGTNWDVASHNGTHEETIPSGIWEYTPETGLYHKHSITHNKASDTVTDYGQARIFGVGGLSEVIVATSPITTDGSFLAGVSYYTSATVTTSGIFYNNALDTVQKAGYLVTPKIFSQNLEDSWNKLVVRFRRFLNSTDKIVVKYRTEDDAFTEATITYASTTTFTVTLASTDRALVVGDEVEIVQGVGAGRVAHITVISGAHAASQTITVDETITGATTQTAKARFQTWKKIASYNSQSDEMQNFPVPEHSAWVQIKVFMIWTGKNEIHDLLLLNKVNRPTE